MRIGPSRREVVVCDRCGLRLRLLDDSAVLVRYDVQFDDLAVAVSLVHRIGCPPASGLREPGRTVTVAAMAYTDPASPAVANLREVARLPAASVSRVLTKVRRLAALEGMTGSSV